MKRNVGDDRATAPEVLDAESLKQLARMAPLEACGGLFETFMTSAAIVQARLLAGRAAATEDRLLTVHEAAKIAGLTPRWFYERASVLAFTRRPSAGKLRFSKAGLLHWIESGHRFDQ